MSTPEEVAAWIEEQTPKSVITTKSLVEENRELWCKEDIGHVEDAIGNSMDNDFIVVHRKRGSDWQRMLIAVNSIVTVTDYR